MERERVRVAGPPPVGRLVLFAGLDGLGLVHVELRVDMGWVLAGAGSCVLMLLLDCVRGGKVLRMCGNKSRNRLLSPTLSSEATLSSSSSVLHAVVNESNTCRFIRRLPYWSTPIMPGGGNSAPTRDDVSLSLAG